MTRGMQSRATRSIAAENDDQDNFSPLATKHPVESRNGFLAAQLRTLGIMGRTQVQAVAEVFSDNALATFDARMIIQLPHAGQMLIQT